MKKIIDLLTIILPALIIMLGTIRLFVKRTKGFNTLTVIFAFILLIAGLIRFYVYSSDNSSEPSNKETPLYVSKHSEVFNNSLEKLLSAYYSMTEGLSKSDTGSVNRLAVNFKSALDSLKIDELKKDSTGIYETATDPYNNLKAEAESIIQDPAMTEKKGSFNILSDNLRLFLVVVKFDRSKLYWMECPDAFGEGRPGNWLSATENTVNPYGIKDCAELRTKIDFVPVDTTQTAH